MVAVAVEDITEVKSVEDTAVTVVILTEQTALTVTLSLPLV